VHIGRLFLGLGNMGDTLRERKREYAVLLCLILIQGFSWFLVIPMLPLYAQHLGADPALVGLIMAFPALFQLFLSIPAGLLAARLGMRYIFLCSYGLGVCAALAYYFAPSFAWLFVAQFFFGLSQTLFWPSQAAYVGDLANPDNRSQLIGFTLGVNAVAIALGPVVAGVLMDTVQVNAAYAVCFFLMALGFLLASSLPATHRYHVSSPSLRKGLLSSLGEIQGTVSNWGVQLAVIGGGLLYVLRGIFDSFFPLYVTDIGLTPTTLGLLLTGSGIATAVIRFGTGPIVRAIGVYGLLLVGLGLISLAVTILPLAYIPVLTWAVVLLVGAGHGSIPVAANTIVVNELDQRYHTTGMAVFETCCGLGRLVGPAAFGYAALAFGLGISFTVAGLVLTLVTLGLAIRTWRVHGASGTPAQGECGSHRRGSS